MTLTTDFGTDGPYVAAMKGVVLSLAPGTIFVDVSHSIEPQDIRQGGFVLASVFPFFPKGTVHLAVVDPGVGTDRRLVAIEFEGHWFVLPDNGLLGAILDGREPSSIRSIENRDLWLPIVAPTFHGRDILAPAAAHLLNGGDPAELGPSIGFVLELDHQIPVEIEGGLSGEVVFIDSFGNLITNICPRSTSRIGSVDVLGHSIDGLIETYGEKPVDSIVALIGSSGRLEVAVVNGSAADRLKATRNTRVRARWEVTA